MSAEPVQSERVEEAHACPSMQLVSFSLEDKLFGLDILKVQEIIRVPDVAAVPHTPGFVEGVITLRGKIVPIIDLRTRFGLPRAEPAASTRIIVVHANQIQLGLMVDAVHEVTCLPPQDIEPAAVGATNTHDYVFAVGKLRDQLVTLIDIDCITTPLQGTPVA